jgi:hypothetical protein
MRRMLPLLVAMIFAAVNGLALAQTTPAKESAPAAASVKPAKAKAQKIKAQVKKSKAKRTRSAKAKQ